MDVVQSTERARTHIPNATASTQPCEGGAGAAEGRRSVMPSSATRASPPTRSMLDGRALGMARRAVALPGAESAAARSVAGAVVTAPTPFDHLFAAFAPRNGWVHSPGSVEATVEKIRVNQEVVLAVGAGGRSSDDVAGALAAARLLARVCRDAGKDVSIFLHGSVPKRVESAFESEGYRLVAGGALTAAGRRLVVSFEGGVRCDRRTRSTVHRA